MKKVISNVASDQDTWRISRIKNQLGGFSFYTGIFTIFNMKLC